MTTNITVNRKLILQLNRLVGSNLIREIITLNNQYLKTERNNALYCSQGKNPFKSKLAHNPYSRTVRPAPQAPSMAWAEILLPLLGLAQLSRK
jgi:hypothetical protein